MVNLLEQGATWLSSQLKASAGRVITYSRGVDSVALTATVGRTEFEQVDGFGSVLRTESRDYLVTTVDLVLAGAATLPQDGDQIAEVIDGETHTYEVMAPGDEPPWRYSDPQQVRLRIHTKHVGTG